MGTVTVFTVTLEDQGVPHDVAERRRSFREVIEDAWPRCEQTVYRGNIIARCKHTAAMVVDEKSLCTRHGKMAIERN